MLRLILGHFEKALLVGWQWVIGKEFVNMFNAVTSWDLSVLNFISENIRCPFLDTFFSFVTKLGDGGVFWIMVTFILLIIPKQRKTGLMMAIAMILGLIIGNGILKNAVARIRPYDLVEAEIIIKHLSDFSFPSGHTLVCFEAASVLTIRKSRLWIPAVVIAVLVAFSRLYLFVHYPTDVIAGAVLGILFGFCGVFLGGKLYDFIAEKKGSTGKE